MSNMAKATKWRRAASLLLALVMAAGIWGGAWLTAYADFEAEGAAVVLFADDIAFTNADADAAEDGAEDAAADILAEETADVTAAEVDESVEGAADISASDDDMADAAPVADDNSPGSGGGLLSEDVWTPGGGGGSFITILHTNDIHGNVGSSASVVGMDKIAAYKRATPWALLVDCGDATQGNSFATLTKGADVIELMNMAGYDVMAAGNHEFDYGLDRLLVNAESAVFPILSANSIKDGKPVLDGVSYADEKMVNNGAWTIIRTGDVNVGFFGVTTPETSTKTNPDGIRGISFGAGADEIAETALAQIESLKDAGADVIIGIMHLGTDVSSDVTSVKIAEALQGSGLDIIIDGHSHTTLNEYVNGVYIAQTGYNASGLGRLDFTVSTNGVKSAITGTIIKAADAAIEPVAEITNKYNEIKAWQDVLLGEKAGATSMTLWGGTVAGINEARIYETNLGDLVADAMLDAVKAHIAGTEYADAPAVALENGGGVRTRIKAGDITRKHVLDVLPFGNILSYKFVTPQILYAAIENGVAALSAQDAASGKITGVSGGFPQIAGMRFEFNPNNPAGGKVAKIVLLNEDGSDGPELGRDDGDTRIVLVSNDFTIAGGDGYTMLRGLPGVGEGGALDQVLADFVGKLTEEGGGSFAYPITQGRARTVGAYEPAPYMAFISGTAGECVAYRVDGGAEQTGTFDDDGVLAFRVNDGPHTVSVEGRDDILVNNYSGAGYYGTAADDIEIYYEIAVTAGDGGVACGSGCYLAGADVTISAVEGEDYDFIGWFEDGVKIDGAGAEYTFAAACDRTLEARFERKLPEPEPEPEPDPEPDPSPSPLPEPSPKPSPASSPPPEPDADQDSSQTSRPARVPAYGGAVYPVKPSAAANDKAAGDKNEKGAASAAGDGETGKAGGADIADQLIPVGGAFAAAHVMQPFDPAGAEVEVAVSGNTLVINGGETAFPAVKYAWYNWLKLRDVAALFNGTEKQFSISYDEETDTIAIATGAAYEPVGDELRPLPGSVYTAYASAQKLIIDGEEISVAAYSIGDYNYFRLRDLMILLDVGVLYDEETGVITLDLTAGYTE